MIDISKIKPGDEVTARHKVCLTNLHRSREPGITADIGGVLIDLPLSAVVTHTPQELSIGDKVVFRSNPKGSYGFVRHVREGNVWVEWSPHAWHPRHEVLPADGLERVS